METEELVPCSNCSKPLVAATSHLHEAYCRRNIIKCPDCAEFVDKKEMAKHKEESHTSKPCKYCKNPFLPALLESHENTSCSQKPEKCAYCTLDVPSTEYAEHISQCGARTKECFICSKNIVLFNFDNHIETCVGQPSYEEQFPAHSSIMNSNATTSASSKSQRQPIFGQVPQYNPVMPQRPATKVQIGQPNSIGITNSNAANNSAQEFARKMKLATENNDQVAIKRLQEEEDERLAREMMYDYSPKNSQKLATKKQVSTNSDQDGLFNDYDYDYEDNNYPESDDDGGDNLFVDNDNENKVFTTRKMQPKPLLTTQDSSQKKNVKDLEDMAEFCDDPELQEAILKSQQYK